MNKAKKTTHGGPDRNQGRRFLDGSKPGEGEYATRHTITLPAELAEYLIRLGGGKLSKGVRVAAECYLKKEGGEVNNEK